MGGRGWGDGWGQGAVVVHSLHSQLQQGYILLPTCIVFLKTSMGLKCVPRSVAHHFLICDFVRNLVIRTNTDRPPAWVWGRVGYNWKILETEMVSDPWGLKVFHL